MHDTVELESRGLPTVMVATVEFTDAAEAQGRALGADPAAVFVSHPIWNRTPDEMCQIAETALDEIVAGLLAAPKPSGD